MPLSGRAVALGGVGLDQGVGGPPKRAVLVQELLQTVGEKCFTKCITKPSTSMSGSESSCVSRCVDRYMEAMGIISRTVINSVPR
ncbi:hypothetical protein KP509_37G040100 [Ceratopteris richardii]|uniref:Mitochondrial import inner membrane translocase subunit n=1 Tax=Ceratopteris richardii TaxID=49495 RepID=A0A8T2Q718_CERRI|nr:hypothetical protein KP509_37G040100 [Ceratopteris richardii]